MSRFDMKNFTNIFKNSIAPYYGTDRIAGATYQVLIETIVENIVRRLAGKRVPVLYSAGSLAIGKSFEGMFFFGDDPLAPRLADWVTSFTDGLKTTPGQYLGQYILTILDKGFVLPSPDLMDAAVTAVAKGLSRTAMKAIGGYLPNNLQTQNDVVTIILQRQKAAGLSGLMAEEPPQRPSGGMDDDGLRRR